MTPFYQAAGKGDLDTLRQLLDRGADPNFASIVNAIDRGHTPLHNACFGDSAAAVRLLIERGADPNKRFDYHSPVDGRTERELTALMFAGSVEVARALLEAGAEVNAQDSNGVTSLMRAAHRGVPDVVRWLLSQGANSAVRSTSGLSAMDFAKSKLNFFLQQQAETKNRSGDGHIKAYEEICRMLAKSGQ